jgi:uncharacterized membrane protein
MKKGVIYSVLAYLSWGFLPLYWRLFQSMPAWEILAHRIVWSLVFVAILVSAAKRWKQLKSAVPNLKSKVAVLLCSIFISCNWFLFIWAVNNGHVIETSLGYYMNPLISVVFAVIFLKERLSVGQWVAIWNDSLGGDFLGCLFCAVWTCQKDSGPGCFAGSHLGNHRCFPYCVHLFIVYSISRFSHSLFFTQLFDCTSSIIGSGNRLAIILVCSGSQAASTFDGRLYPIYCSDNKPAVSYFCISRTVY